MKKASVLIVCMLLLLAAAGCGKAGNSSSSAASVNPSQSQSSEPAEEEPEIIWPTVTVAEDDWVRVEIEGFRGIYTAADIVDLNILVTNKGAKQISYVKGSGSNSVPDALQVELDNLIALYHPDVMVTLDYGVEMLEAGETVRFECPIAPYRTELENFLPEKGSGIEFFRDNEAFTPAQAGIIQGIIRFSYIPLTEEGEPNLMLYDETDVVTAEGDFSIEIQ